MSIVALVTILPLYKGRGRKRTNPRVQGEFASIKPKEPKNQNAINLLVEY